ncbi:hypothetical protein GVX82_01930 [Patescibacteria group bacterium]|nr:hypothetical protein [Patescibacteria group bacterium]
MTTHTTTLRASHSLWQRAGASVTLVALLSLVVGTSFVHSTVHAAALTDVRDVLSDSDVSADATHSIFFRLATDLDGGETVTFTFDPDGQAFDLSTLTTADLAGSSTGFTVVDSGGCGTGGDELEVTSIDDVADVVTFTVCGGDSVASSTYVGFEIGSTSGNQVGNPSSVGSYGIEIAGTFGDTGTAQVAIVEDVTVTASVETTLTFSVSGVDASQTVNSEPLSTTGTSTATSVPFGVLASGSPAVLAQDLSVTTNAINGFTVTVEADQTLTAGNAADIDTFVDGSGTSTPTSWSGPAATFGTENTYGHWGITSEDSTLVAGDTFGAALYVGDFVGSPREVFYHDASADGTTPDEGQTRVGFKAEVSALQEAASDYTASLSYVVTPVF